MTSRLSVAGLGEDRRSLLDLHKFVVWIMQRMPKRFNWPSSSKWTLFLVTYGVRAQPYRTLVAVTLQHTVEPLLGEVPVPTLRCAEYRATVSGIMSSIFINLS